MADGLRIQIVFWLNVYFNDLSED